MPLRHALLLIVTALVACILTTTRGNTSAQETSFVLASEAGTGKILKFNAATGEELAPFATGLIQPQGLDWGPDGNLYVAEYGANRVVRITPDGVWSVFAKVAEIPGAQSENRGVISITFDRQGYALVACHLEAFGSLHRFGPDGTPAGLIASGLDAPYQVRVGPDDRIYVAMRGGVFSFAPDGSDRQAVAAGGGFEGLAFSDSGDLYFSSWSAARIFRWNATEGVAVATTFGLSRPVGIEFDNFGRLWIAQGLSPSGLATLQADMLTEHVVWGKSYLQWVTVYPPRPRVGDPPPPPADTAAPTTAVEFDPAPNAAGWHNTQTSVTLRATDNEGGSGVAATYYAVNGGDPEVYAGSPITFSTEGEYQVGFWSVDVAGNLETWRSIGIKIDTTKPTLTFGAPSPAPNGTGWNNTAVSIPYITADNLSGVASASTGSPLRITSEGFGQTGSVTVTDQAGNTGTFTSPAVDIDLTPPSLSASDVEATATRANGADVSFAPAASDTLSGLAGIVCTAESGSAFPLGTTTVTCTATDVAGNTATTRTFTVNVTFSWSGVLQPVNADGSSVFKVRQPIPLKFKLTGASSGITDLVAHLSYQRVGEAMGSINEADQQGNADTGNRFRYDAAGDLYLFTMNTQSLSRGKYRLIIDLHDGVSRTVEVSLR